MSLHNWSLRLHAISDIFNRARGRLLQRGAHVAEAGDTGHADAIEALRRSEEDPTHVEIEQAGGLLTLMSALNEAQPHIDTRLLRALDAQPPCRVGTLVESIRDTTPAGTWLVGWHNFETKLPFHMSAVSIDQTGTLPRYTWYEPNYGLVSFHEALPFRAFLDRLIPLAYAKGIDPFRQVQDARDIVVNTWHVVPEELAAVQIFADDELTLGDIVRRPPDPPPPPPRKPWDGEVQSPPRADESDR
jgi:hypothetical protein